MTVFRPKYSKLSMKSYVLDFFHILPCCKIGEGHPRVIIGRNYDGPKSPKLHTKFHCNRPTGSGDEDF